MSKTVDYYMRLPYRVELREDKEEGGLTWSLAVSRFCFFSCHCA